MTRLSCWLRLDFHPGRRLLAVFFAAAALCAASGPSQAYDRGAAVAYCNAWCGGRNPAYPDNSDIGGDCSNFVSQCLIAGGVDLGGGTIGGGGELSDALRGQGWASTYGCPADQPGNIQPGDVIQFYGDCENYVPGSTSNCNLGHSVFVVSNDGSSGDSIGADSHSGDHCNAGWSTWAYMGCEEWLHFPDDVPPTPPLAAVYVGQGSDARPDDQGLAYFQVCTEEQFHFWFEVRNTGASTWVDWGPNDQAWGHAVRLGVPGDTLDPLAGVARISLNENANPDVHPEGADCNDQPVCARTVFTRNGIPATAPATPGVVQTMWQLVDESRAWFGPQMTLTFNVVDCPEPDGGSADGGGADGGGLDGGSLDGGGADNRGADGGGATISPRDGSEGGVSDEGEGGMDSRSVPPITGGCNCSATPRSGSGSGLAVGLAFAIALTRLRRDRPSPPTCAACAPCVA